MREVLTLVALLSGAPDGMRCNVATFDARATILVVCEDVRTGGWFVARLERATGLVRRASGRRS